MKVGRNDPCSCGSGKKYKACCAVKPARSQIMTLVALVAFAGITGWVVGSALMTDSSPPPGKVWSEEHGHYHDAPTDYSTDTSGSADN